MYRNKKRCLMVLALGIIVVLIVSGCATHRSLALSSQTKSLELTQESIALLSIRTSNVYKTGYQPDITNFIVFKLEGNSTKDEVMIGDKVGVLEPVAKDEKLFNEYLISLPLSAGRYRLYQAIGFGGAFPVRGSFSILIQADFDLSPNSIIYLGHIDATLRERKNDNELRAGPVMPLIDQATTGFYSGTFDVTITDNYDKDVAAFKKKYPILNSHPISKSVLSAGIKP